MGLYSLTMSKEGKAHFIMLFFISHRLLNPLSTSQLLSSHTLTLFLNLSHPISPGTFLCYPSRPFIVLISAVRSCAIISDFMITLPYAFSHSSQTDNHNGRKNANRQRHRHAGGEYWTTSLSLRQRRLFLLTSTNLHRHLLITPSSTISSRKYLHPRLLCHPPL